MKPIFFKIHRDRHWAKLKSFANFSSEPIIFSVCALFTRIPGQTDRQISLNRLSLYISVLGINSIKNIFKCLQFYVLSAVYPEKMHNICKTKLPGLPHYLLHMYTNADNQISAVPEYVNICMF